MNPITEKIFYIDNDKQNQRFIISSMTQNPRAWQVSKCEDMLMGEFGLMRLTFVQVAFNKTTDYIDYNATNPDGTKDVYAMYANYFQSSVLPVHQDSQLKSEPRCVLSSSTSVIKTGGSYKTITATFYDDFDTDISDKYSLVLSNWSFYIDDINVTNEEIISILPHKDNNKIKIRFGKHDEYLTKTLTVKCTADDVIGELSLEIAKL